MSEQDKESISGVVHVCYRCWKPKGDGRHPGEGGRPRESELQWHPKGSHYR